MGDIVNSVMDIFGAGPASKQASATKDAAAQSAAAAKYATDLQREMWQAQQAQQQPWLEAGQTALNKLIPLATNYTPFSQTNWQQDPGYAFRLVEGQKALERSAAARGGLLSGAAGKALVNYGQQAGSQEYTNAFNRYQTERANQLQPLQSLAGVGQTAANTLGAAGQNYASNAGNIAGINAANQGNALLNMGNIRSSQYGTAGSALNTALNTNWTQVGNKLGGWFGGGAGSSNYGGSVQGNPDYIYDL